jgi:hypothetical protein
MTSSDTLTYVSGNGQILITENITGSPVTYTITGSGATTISPLQYGGTISVAAGKAITVGANAVVHTNLDGIGAFLVGTITLTGGTGLVARLLNN